MAYVTLDAGKQSLWMRQVSAPNDAQIMGPSNVRYLGLTFSPDGNYVFFVTYVDGQNEGVLYRIPAIGGAPQVVIRDIDSPVTFSPDGKQLAFVRGYLATRETALVIAHTDGTSEQKIASRVFPAFFPSEGPAWSPNGIIACGVRRPDPTGISETIVGVDPMTREEKLLTDQKWAEVGRLSWNQGGTRLILTAAQALGPHQLWQISSPEGLAHRMTNDLTDYRGSPGVNKQLSSSDRSEFRIWVTTAQHQRWNSHQPGMMGYGVLPGPLTTDWFLRVLLEDVLTFGPWMRMDVGKSRLPMMTAQTFFRR